VEEHASRPRFLDGVEHPLDPIREALEERAVVERRAELGAVHPVLPERRVLVDPVERDVDRLDPVGRGGTLVVLAQVDDGPDPVVAERAPPVGSQVVERRRANQRAAASEPAVARGQPAEVARVGTAVPVEVAG
jgi:hypothetical protein